MKRYRCPYCGDVFDGKGMYAHLLTVHEVDNPPTNEEEFVARYSVIAAVFVEEDN